MERHRGMEDVVCVCGGVAFELARHMQLAHLDPPTCSHAFRRVS